MLELSEWESVSEVLEFLYRKLELIIAARGEELIAREIHIIIDFKSWLSDSGVHLFNSWKNRQDDEGLLIEAPHWFLYKQRVALNDHERKLLGAAAAGGDPADVFCSVKNFISDPNYMQNPVLVMPKAHGDGISPHPLGHALNP